MQSVIYDPLKEFLEKYKDAHQANTSQFLDNLVRQSGINIEENRATIQRHEEYTQQLAKLRKKYNWTRFYRVLMCITLVLIPVVITKTTPKVKQLKADIDEADKRADELMELAHRQMQPLNQLFTDRDAITILETTLPGLKFEDYFSAQQEADMKINYDFTEQNQEEQSTIEVLAGHCNGNPFLFENLLIHTMGTETYHGYKTIYWTETYRDSDGNLKTRQKSQTLHATVTKPKPFYHTRVILNYCAQGAPELTFSRDADHVEKKNDKEIQRLVKRGERKLERKDERAVRDNESFTSMSNTEFEVLFDALDRDNEVQFRTLFTPLAQTNMVSLLRSQEGYGDDFLFVKSKRTNRIVSDHSQNRAINLTADRYPSHSYDVIQENFTTLNAGFFKAVYFDFAPIWAIPMYQEAPVHSLAPIPDSAQVYSLKQCEVLANTAESCHMAHPDSKTQAILKSAFVSSKNGVDKTRITAYSYDVEQRVDIVTMRGDDGHYHDVPVEWDEYLPLVAHNNFYVTNDQTAEKNKVIARHNGLCICNP